MKEPLRPGTKIKFVGPVSQTPRATAGNFALNPARATVVEDHGDGEVEISFEKQCSEARYTIHRRQVTHRLRKKAKPAEERVERWYSPEMNGYAEHYTAVPQPSLKNYVRLLELKPGEAIVGRAALARAILQYYPGIPNHKIFDIIDVLGLPEAP